MRTIVFVAAVWTCVTVAAPARVSAQDSLSGLRGVLEERQHRIEVTLAPGHATLLVQRTVENLGPRHDQADWQIYIPGTAAATQLRTRGVLDGVPRWFVGELMEAEDAAKKYRELTGVGGYYPKDPALLSWRSQGHLALQVFPVPPGERKTISYTLKMPTEYRDGRHELTIPALGAAGAPADVVIRPRDEHDRLLVNGQAFPAGGRLTAGPDETRIALVPAWAPAVGGALGGTRLSADRALVHFRIEAAPRLGRVPRDAQVVVILDWSRSLDQSLCQAGVAGAAAFLRHFEGASVEVLTVDREVRRRFGRLVPVGRALADLNAIAVERRNGSHLDVALAQADALLAAAPGGHARRVVLLSDLRTRAALDVSKLAGAFRRSGALLHVAHIDEGRPVALVPVAEGESSGWSDVARRTGGLQWNATLVHGATEAPNGEMAATLEELARPVRIHHFRAAAPWIDVASDDVLNEGQGLAGLQIARDVPPSLEIAGELWARPIRVRLSPDPTASRLWSALVFGSDLMEELDEREMMILARHGGAVSPVTSYLAIEPGVRPSTEGIPLDGSDTALGGMGEGNIELGNLGTFAQGGGGSFDHVAWLRKALEPARKRCGYAGRPITVAIETTIDEIVDIPALPADVPGDRACLREAIWSVELPAAFASKHDRWTVRFDP